MMFIRVLNIVRRTKDWLNQALRDLQHAREDLRSGFYEWACFSAQQAAEKAIKALYQALGVDVWGHSTWRLLANLPEGYRPSSDLIDLARELDRFYMPTRYPNMHPSGAPYEYYTEKDARRAIEIAERIIQFCRDKIEEIE